MNKDIDYFSTYWYRGQKYLNQGRSDKTEGTGEWYSLDKLIASTYSSNTGYMKKIKLKRLNENEYIIFDCQGTPWNKFSIKVKGEILIGTDQITRYINLNEKEIKVVIFKNIIDYSSSVNKLSIKFLSKDMNERVSTTLVVIDDNSIDESETVSIKDKNIENFSSRVNIKNPIRLSK